MVIPSVRQDLDNTSLEYYLDDLPSPGTLQADIECWRCKWVNDPNPPSTLSAALKACNRQIFPNIYTILKIAATFPVTSCECEMSISTLGNVKTSCRSTMGEERLTGLCLMSVHRDIDVNVSDIVKQFARQNSRKMKLPCILESDLSNEDNDLC